MTIAVLIPTKNVKEAEPFVVESIEKALKYSGNHYNLQDVMDLIYDNKAQLWILWNENKKDKYQGCIVSKVITRPNTKSLNLFIVTGKNRKLWQDKIKTIEKWAKQQGCTHLETYARPGWSRILKQHNYKVTHYLLERKLEE
tara:strand:+ start:226 stop:651 length:426 start_codon:yes stop_codon:yes gene_type:complete